MCRGGAWLGKACGIAVVAAVLWRWQQWPAAVRRPLVTLLPALPCCPLPRAMEFIVALLERLQADRAVTLSEAASETYYATLQRFHGWIVTGTFTLALKLVPSRCAQAGSLPGGALLAAEPACWPWLAGAAGAGTSAPPLTALPRHPPGRCRETFLQKVAEGLDEEAVMQQMHAFCTQFGGVLGEVQAFLAAAQLDDPAKV